MTGRVVESAGITEQSHVLGSLTSTLLKPCFYSYQNRIVKIIYKFGIRDIISWRTRSERERSSYRRERDSQAGCVSILGACKKEA